MTRSLLLGLRLGFGALRRPAAASVSATIAVPRPEGPLIWLSLGSQADLVASAQLLIRRLCAQRPGLRILLSTPGDTPAELAAGHPETVIIAPAPEDLPAAVGAMLDHWRPDLLVHLGNDLPAALIRAAESRGVAQMLADARVGLDAAGRWHLVRGMTRALLDRMGRILVRDQTSAAALARLGIAAERVEVGGLLGEPPEPLKCSENERAAIAAQMRQRPVWLATSVPEAEMGAVLAAHTHVLRHAHRMLLILAPDAPGDAAVLAEQLRAEGWSVGRRSWEGEPDDDVQIFLADDPNDYGLWYRLSPLSFMGGTFSGAALAPRSPLEPAALGAAVIHGPRTAPFAADYARLDEARAARPIAMPLGLGEALADLIAPDRAAQLAHNAWAVTSGGAGAAAAVAQAILAELDRAAGDEGRR